MGGQREPVVFDFDSDTLGYLRRGGGFTPLGTDMLVPVLFGASGDDHAPGLVPDPGSASGSTRYLCEDGTWAVPAGGGGGSVSDGDYGDIVVSSSGTVWTIDTNVVSNSKFRQSVANSVVGRASGSTGNVGDIQATTTWSFLGFNGTSLSFLVPDHSNLSSSSLVWTSSGHLGSGGVRKVAGFDTSNAAVFYTLETSSADTTALHIVTCDDTRLSDARTPTGSAGGDLTGTYPNPTIAANAVTDAKLRQGGACSVVGRSANSTGNVADISAGSNDTLFGRFSNALGFRTVIAWLGVVLTTTGAMITFDGTNVIQSSFLNPGFGPGVDGAVSYVANTTLAGNVNATNGTISSAVRVSAAGFLLRFNGTLTLTDATSILSNNGANGVGTTQGAGAPGATLGGGSAGGSGSSAGGAGSGSSSRTNSWPISFSATNTGKGGDGGSDAGGTHAGGTAATPGAVSTNNKTFGVSVYDIGDADGATQLFGGTGGGGGGSSGVGNNGGGGGGGGGVLIVWAFIVNGAGTIEANGGDGANAAVGAGSAGGGGGGGGGAAVLLYHVLQSSAPTVRANGGAKGLKGGGGNDGNVGTAGYAETRIVA